MPTQVRGEQRNMYYGGGDTAGVEPEMINKVIEYAYTGKRRAEKYLSLR